MNHHSGHKGALEDQYKVPVTIQFLDGDWHLTIFGKDKLKPASITVQALSANLKEISHRQTIQSGQLTNRLIIARQLLK